MCRLEHSQPRFDSTRSRESRGQGDFQPASGRDRIDARRPMARFPRARAGARTAAGTTRGKEVWLRAAGFPSAKVGRGPPAPPAVLLNGRTHPGFRRKMGLLHQGARISLGPLTPSIMKKFLRFASLALTAFALVSIVPGARAA